MGIFYYVFSNLSNPFKKVALCVFFQVPPSENRALKWDIVAPPAVVKYTFKPQSTGRVAHAGHRTVY